MIPNAPDGPAEQTTAPRPPVRVVLVDDHEIVRRGVRELLEADGAAMVVGEAGSVAEAMVRVPALKPQVAVLDVRLPDGNGVQLCRDLRSAMPELACLMLTSFSDDEALQDAILAGAAGYVLKQIRGMDLVAAVESVATGASLLDPLTTARLLQRLRRQAEHADPLAALSEQEHRVLMWIGEGLTNRQIAAKMFLSEKTVKNYVSTLLAKLGLQRRTQAAVLINRLVTPPLHADAAPHWVSPHAPQPEAGGATTSPPVSAPTSTVDARMGTHHDSSVPPA